jgi:gliding motility-associated-like protein
MKRVTAALQNYAVLITAIVLANHFAFSQCGITINTTVQNHDPCGGCTYSGPSILINEVSLEPTIGDGSLFGLNSAGIVAEGEWIELYNPDWCNSVDISGYILGSFNSNGDTFFQPVTSNAMAFSLPQGTVVPPLGFVIVRGSNAPVPPPGVIDIVVNNANNGVCIGGGLPPQSRIWFQNSQGWFAFYDNNGVMQDAISWGVPSPASDYNQSPCIPPNNSLPGGTVLPSYNAGGVGTNLGFPMWGMSFVRIPDGGNWSSMQLPEFNSYGDCNDPNNCLTIGSAPCNGTATINVLTGGGPFGFQWDDPDNQTSQTATGLCPGDYNVTITNNSGCSQTFPVTIGNDQFEINANVVQPSCNNNDGQITLTPSPAGNYTFQWNPNVSTTNSATNLGPGSYQITVIDDNNCQKDTTIVLTQPNAFQWSFTVDPPDCGVNNGSIAVQVTPAGSYTFNWNPNVSTSNTASNLGPGSYQIEVSDGVCTLDTTIQLSNPNSPNLTLSNQQNVSCFGGTNGSATVAAQGGTPPYNFTWQPGNLTGATQNNLSAGTYTVTAEDAAGCSGVLTVVITEPAQLNVQLNVTNASCGLSNGQIQANVIGGNSPFSYAWTPNVGAGSTISNLGAGNYSLTVTDNNGCSASANAEVLSTDAPIITLNNLINETCPGDQNGSISISVSNGAAPYSFAWSPNVGNQSTVSNLSAGSYTVTVTDNEGCQVSQTFQIQAPEALIITENIQPSYCALSDGSISINVNNGTGPFSFDWENIASTQNNVTGLDAGIYNVTITDQSNGCAFNFSFEVGTTGGLDVQITPFNPVIEEDENLILTANVSGGNNNYTFNWSPQDWLDCTNCSSVVFQSNNSGVVIVQVIDSDGCVGSDTTFVTVNSPCIGVHLPTIFSPNGDGKHDEFCILGNCFSGASLAIYNRWGERIFNGTGEDACWDGTHRGKNAGAGVYVYKLTYLDEFGELQVVSGNVTLLR